jgi:hypothetical protein
LPAVQAARESARRSQCINNLKQFALGIHNFENTRGHIPRGSYANPPAGQPPLVFPEGGNVSWMFVTLGYIEQGNLHQRVASAGSLANAINQGILPATLPIIRCPSDVFERSNFKHSNYIGSTGPNCNNHPTGCPNNPFQMHCNGAPTVYSTNVAPPALNPPTHPGYEPSITHGSTSLAEGTRGMFGRGHTATNVLATNPPGSPVIRLASVTDGTSNTLLLGETLPEHFEPMRYPGTTAGWPQGSNHISQGQTIQPINWRIDRMAVAPPAYITCGCDANTNPSGDKNRCIMNWAVTWGFKSNHPNGTNFARVDGLAQFISQNIDMRTYQYLGCRDDGQAVSAP